MLKIEAKWRMLAPSWSVRRYIRQWNWGLDHISRSPNRLVTLKGRQMEGTLSESVTMKPGRVICIALTLFFFAYCVESLSKFPFKQLLSCILCSSNLSLFLSGIHRCGFPKRVGYCLNFKYYFYYDNNTKKCELFRYSGCGGNRNRFSTYSECQRVCILN